MKRELLIRDLVETVITGETPKHAQWQVGSIQKANARTHRAAEEEFAFNTL